MIFPGGVVRKEIIDFKVFLSIFIALKFKAHE